MFKRFNNWLLKIKHKRALRGTFDVATRKRQLKSIGKNELIRTVIKHEILLSKLMIEYNIRNPLKYLVTQKGENK